MKTDPNSPAMSCTVYETDNEYPQLEHKVNYKGLTKREHFAAMAMQGILSNSGRNLITTPNMQFSPDVIKKISQNSRRFNQ